MHEDLAKRIQILEDIEAIRMLKAAYCAACDDNHNPQKLAPLFTPDGVWEATSTGRAEGREQIAKLLGDIGQSGRIRNSAHHAINPQISIAGDSAYGHWRLIMLYTGVYPNGERHYSRIIGWYQETYARIAGQWLIHNLHCEVEEHAPYQLAPHQALNNQYNQPIQKA